MSDNKKKCDPNKAHGHDMDSMQMLKLRVDSVLPLLEFIFKYSLQSGTSPSELKKGHVVPSHKMSDKQSLKKLSPYCYSLSVGKLFND